MARRNSSSGGGVTVFLLVVAIAAVAAAWNFIKEHALLCGGIAAAILIFVIGIRAINRADAKGMQEAALAEAHRKAEEAKQKAASESAAMKAAMEREKAAPVPADDDAPVIHVPDEVDSCALAYHYDDVDIVPTEGSAQLVRLTEPLNIQEEDGTLVVFQGSNKLGSMAENKIADMVRDWTRRGDPFRAYVASYSSDSAQVAIFFYRDALQTFKQRHKITKEFKLTGKPEDFASASVGDACHVEVSFDSDKLAVTCGGDVLGYLPAGCVSFAEKNGISPEDLDIVVSVVDYDLDKDRDVFHVLAAAD